MTSVCCRVPSHRSATRRKTNCGPERSWSLWSRVIPTREVLRRPGSNSQQHWQYVIGSRQACRGTRVARAGRGDLDKLLNADQTKTKYRSVLARAYINIGHLRYSTREYALALAAFQKARVLQEMLVKEEPTVLLYRADLSKCYNGIGVLFNENGMPAEALIKSRKGQDDSAKTRRRLPERPAFPGRPCHEPDQRRHQPR